MMAPKALAGRTAAAPPCCQHTFLPPIPDPTSSRFTHYSTATPLLHLTMTNTATCHTAAHAETCSTQKTIQIGPSGHAGPGAGYERAITASVH